MPHFFSPFIFALTLLITFLLSSPAQAAWPLSSSDALTLCSCTALLARPQQHLFSSSSSSSSSPPVLAQALTRLAKRAATTIDADGSTTSSLLPGMHPSCAASTRSALTIAAAFTSSPQAHPTATTSSSSEQVRALRHVAGLVPIDIGDNGINNDGTAATTLVQLHRSLVPSANPTAQGPMKLDDAQPGFHRQLRTELLVQFEASESKSAIERLNQCQLLMLETVPSTFYFDLYQLDEVARFRTQQQQQQQQQQGGEQETLSYPSMRALSLEDMDVEASTENSPPHLLWLLVEQATWRDNTTSVASTSTTATLTVQVPIHARYQAARRGCDENSSTVHGGCLRNATIHSPLLWIRCPLSPASSATMTADADVEWSPWIRMPSTQDSEALSMSVPIATLENVSLVRNITFAVSMGAAISLCILVWWQSKRDGKETRAQHTD